MMKKLILSMVLVTALSLGFAGCATSVLMEETGRAVNYTQKAEKFAEDSVVGFVM